ncbi:MAG: rod shape-determining protein [Chloroflexota bacterium]|nr:rod shape-determining protein [Chloroflexota bacterium]MDQ5851703.1 rod shape-determining protein [Chloroflexota bacterium]
MLGRSIGIDLGTANVLVFVRGKGVVLNEPSVVAISTRDGRVKAVGRAAYDMLGRTPDTVEVVRPMQNGVISDYLVTEALLKAFIAKALGRFSMFKPKVMICIPAGVTSVERRAVRDAAMQAGAQEAYLIREPLAAAIGARVPVDSPTGSMVVDIGGGTTEVAVIALNGIVVSTSVRVGGDKLDQAIASYIKRKYNLLIGDRTAEQLKIEIGSALPLDPDDELVMEVRGRDQVAGLPRTIEVRTNEVVEAFSEPLEQIVGAVRTVLEKTPPELASDIIDRGMVMTGGGALLRHIDELLTQVTGIPCFIADNPLACVAVGTGMALENLEVLKDSLTDD